jgi:hypothetical protein
MNSESEVIILGDSSDNKHELTTARTLTYKSKNKYKSGFKISMKDFLSCTTQSDRDCLRLALNESIGNAITAGRHVLLEGFGIILVSEDEETKAYNSNFYTIIRNEKVRKLDFEKCLHFEKADQSLFPCIVKTAELAKMCHLALPSDLNIRWSENNIKKLLRCLIKLIKEELIHTGYSYALPAIGNLYAIHNRQGFSIDDWYAGADIFLDNSYRKVIDFSEQTWHNTPTYTSCIEPLETAFGRIHAHTSLNLDKELVKLGFEIDPEEPSHNIIKKPIKIYAFKNEASNSYIFCTQGIANNESMNHHAELVWQINKEQHLDQTLESYLTLVKQIFTLGWILLISAKKEANLVGASITADFSEYQRIAPNLSAIILNEFSLYKREAYMNDGAYRYLNVLTITGSEYKIAKKISASALLNVLSHKGIGQINKLERSSINWNIENEYKFEEKNSLTMST